MTSTYNNSFSYFINLNDRELTGLRLFYEDASAITNDSVSLQRLSIKGDEPKSAFTFFPQRVAGVDLQGNKASGATDAGLILNADIHGVYPYNSDSLSFTLNPEAFTISGSEIRKFSYQEITFEAEIQEINDKDGNVELRLEWRDGSGTWNSLGSISTTYLKESNADWQLLDNSVAQAPPIIGYENQIPLNTNRDGLFTLNQPENKKNVGDFISDQAVNWSLSGVDANLLTINESGYLIFKEAPDYENPIDDQNDNTYNVNIIAENSPTNTSFQAVEINIEDVDESCKLVINNTNDGLTLNSNPGYCTGERKWLEINLINSLTGDLDNYDWVGVKIIGSDGVLRDLGGLGHSFSDSGQLISKKALLVDIEEGEILQLTKLNPPDIGGESVETVEFNKIDSSIFEATLGNDLVLKIQETTYEPPTWEKDTLAIQTSPSDGIFDFRQPNDPSPLDLSVRIKGNCGDFNQVGIVELDIDPTTGIVLESVNGVTSTSGAAFRAAVRENIQGFDGVLPTCGGGNHDESFNWTLDSGEKGAYALVVINSNGDVYTFGSNTSADGKQHIKELGKNLFGFEDLSAGNGADWDFNDIIIEIKAA